MTLDLAVTPGLGTPPGEVAVTPNIVRGLLRAQHPDLADLSLVEVASGWDNVTYRLGERLAVRLPRRALAGPLVRHEQRWLPVLAPGLPLPVPAPIRVGLPQDGYPFHWSVVAWFEGRSADPAELGESAAEVLGGFLRALHVPAPPDAPANPYRGVALAERMAGIERWLGVIAGAPSGRGFGRPDLARLRGIAQMAARAPTSGSRVWLHGDLHPANLLVRDARLAAVIDWGDITAGDVATDLASAWMLFDRDARVQLRAAHGEVDDVTWLRARGWAVLFGAALLGSGLNGDARFAATGRRTLQRVLEEDDPHGW